MADSDALSYLQQALAQKRSNQAKGSNIVNQGDSLTTASSSAHDGNAWEKIAGTTQSVINGLDYGVKKSVEGIIDFGAGVAGTVGSWFDADTSWASDFIKRDLSNEWQQAETQYGFNPLRLGDSISYWTNGNDMDNLVSNKSVGYDLFGESGMETAKSIENTVGQMLPALILAGVTSGASLAAEGTSYAGIVAGMAKAAQTATLLGESISAGGQATENAINNGADIGKATGYGALTGGFVALEETALSALGANLFKNVTNSSAGLSEKAGQTLANFVSKRGAKESTVLLANKVGQIAIDALGEGLEEVLEDSVDPLWQQITYNQNALSQVYGTDEGRQQLAQQMGTDFLLASLISAGIGGVTGVASEHNLKNQKIKLDQKVKEELNASQNKARNIEKLENIEVIQAQELEQAGRSDLADEHWNNALEYEKQRAEVDAEVDNALKKAKKQIDEQSKVAEADADEKEIDDYVDQLDKGNEQTTTEEQKQAEKAKSEENKAYAESFEKELSENEEPVSLYDEKEVIDENGVKETRRVFSRAKAEEILMRTSAYLEAVHGNSKVKLDTKYNSETLYSRFNIDSPEAAKKVFESILDNADFKYDIDGKTYTVKGNEISDTLKSKYLEVMNDIFDYQTRNSKSVSQELKSKIADLKQQLKSTIEQVYEERKKKHPIRMVSKVIDKAKSVSTKTVDNIKVPSDIKEFGNNFGDGFTDGLALLKFRGTKNNENVDTTEALEYYKEFNEAYDEKNFTDSFDENGNVKEEGVFKDNKVEFSQEVKDEIESFLDKCEEKGYGNKEASADEINEFVKFGRLMQKARKEYEAKIRKGEGYRYQANYDQKRFGYNAKQAEQGLFGKIKATFIDKIRNLYGSINSLATNVMNNVFGQGSVASRQVQEITNGVGSRDAFVIEQKLKMSDFAKNHQQGFNHYNDTVNYKGHDIEISELQYWAWCLKLDHKTNNYLDASKAFTFRDASGLDITLEYEADTIDADTKEATKEGTLGQITKLMDEKCGEGFTDAMFDFVVNDIFGNENVRKMMAYSYFRDNRGDNKGLFAKGTYLPCYAATKVLPNFNSGKVEGVFTNKSTMKRVSVSQMGLRAVNTLQMINKYMSDLGTSYYVMPRIADLQASLTDVYGSLDKSSRSFVDEFVDSAKGVVKQESGSWLGSAYTTIAISMPKTWIKQMLSYYTSGIGLDTMVKYMGQINSNAFFDPKMNDIAFKGEFETAWNYLCEEMPELKTRGQSNVVLTGNMVERISKLGSILSKGNTYTDVFTVRKVVLGSLLESLDEYRSIHPGENITASDKGFLEYATYKVRRNFQTQITSNSALKSPLQLGNYYWAKNKGGGFGKLISRVFSPFSGAITGVMRNFDTTIAEIRSFSKLKKADILSDINQTDIDLDRANGSLKTAKERLDNLKSEYEENRKQDSGFGKTDNGKALKEKIETAQKSVTEAQRNVDSLGGQASSLKQLLKDYQRYQASGGTTKRMTSLAGGLIASGILATALDELFKRILNKKEWDEWDWGDFAKDAALNSTLNMIPVVRSIVSTLTSGYESSDPTSEAFSMITGLISDVSALFTEGFTESTGKTLARDGAEAIGLVFGVPVSQIWNYYYGITSQINPDLAIASRNLFYFTSTTASFSDNPSLYITERVGTPSSELESELVSLYDDDLNALPTAISSTYKDSSGNEATISWTDKNSIRKYYSQANSDLVKLIKSSQYKSLSQSQKASAIKKIYSAYKEAAMSKTLGSKYQTSTILGNLAKYKSSDLNDIVSAIAYISDLEADSSHTKKELATSYVNSLKGLKKGAKLLILRLSGYSVDDTAVKNYLKSQGLSNSEIKGLLS